MGEGGRAEEVASSKNKRLKNHTLWGGTYLYSPYKGVPPPPGMLTHQGECDLCYTVDIQSIREHNTVNIEIVYLLLIDQHSLWLAINIKYLGEVER